MFQLTCQTKNLELVMICISMYYYNKPRLINKITENEFKHDTSPTYMSTNQYGHGSPTYALADSYFK